MHSRIFQVSTEPIEKCDYIIESDYWDHWFTNSFADYVNDDCDREYDISWLDSCYGTDILEFGVDNNGNYFIIKNKQKYFEGKYNRFVETIEKIKNCTIDEFIKSIGHEIWTLKDAYEDKFGFYIQTSENGLITLDSFMRAYPEGTKFYIGGTIDYHY